MDSDLIRCPWEEGPYIADYISNAPPTLIGYEIVYPRKFGGRRLLNIKTFHYLKKYNLREYFLHTDTS